MQIKNYSFPIEHVRARLRIRIYADYKNDLLLSTINEIISIKNKKEILVMAKYLQKRYKYTSAIYSYITYLDLDKTNDLVYYNLGLIYKRGNYKEKLKKDLKKSREYFEKAEKLGNKDAKLELLISYSLKKRDVKKYFKLKEKLKKSTQGKLVLAKYFRKTGLKNKSNNILEELANKDVQEAILLLALIKPSKYNFDPEEYQLTLKWQEYIIQSKNKELENKFRNKLIKYRYDNNFEKSKSYYTKQYLKNVNIIRLRELYKNNRYAKKEEALSYLNKAAKANDVKSIMNLARIYSFNRKDLDFNKMINVITPLVKQGDKKAIRFLANRYIQPPEGFEKYKNINKALFYYEQLANYGDETYIRKLVDLYLCKTCYEGKVINYKKALYYLKKLDKRKYPIYYASIGWIYNFGKGIEIDLLKAKEYYEISAKKNYKHAYYYLASLYYNNQGSDRYIIERNYKKALYYLKQGTKAKDANSSNLLGLFYQEGYGVEKDIEEAVVYYKQFADSNKFSAFYLAEYYKNKKDYKNAVKYYKVSAKRKFAPALVLLGILYEEGRLGKIDCTSALKYYKKAYQINKDEIAAYSIALIYHYGKGDTKVNYKIARKWYKLSSTKQANLGLLDLDKKLSK
ncbi:MAG: sel1 repeat family protein [Campylobacteraceae bacterium]|nr:sel1 repeat family protein [Campylobacteraceae bacterium]